MFACKDRDILFQVDPLRSEDIASLHFTGVLKHTAPVTPQRLNIVRVSYWDFEGNPHASGELMVLDAVADYVLNIFKSLYDQKFPIARIRLMNEYQGEDSRSMDDNNTSCFNDRSVIGDSTLSLHAYGLAIDLNPLQNPFVYLPDEAPALTIYSPAEGRTYANRQLHRPGKAFRPGMAEQVIDVFHWNGFTVWGGHWDTPIDYQHFQVNRELAELLATMTSEEAKLFFKAHVDFTQQNQDLCATILKELHSLIQQEKKLIDYYQQERKHFYKIFHEVSEAA